MSLKRLVCAAAVVAAAGAAFATTTKLKYFGPSGAGLTCNPEADGMAIFKFDETTGNSHVHVHMQDLQPYTTYSVAAMSDAGSTSPDFAWANAFTTNASGNGNFDVDAQNFNFGSNPGVYIFIWDGTIEHLVDDVTPDEARAFGTVGH